MDGKVLNWRSTKFIQTTFVLVACTVLRGMDAIDDYTYLGVTVAALGNYAHFDTKSKELK